MDSEQTRLALQAVTRILSESYFDIDENRPRVPPGELWVTIDGSCAVPQEEADALDEITEQIAIELGLWTPDEGSED